MSESAAYAQINQAGVQRQDVDDVSLQTTAQKGETIRTTNLFDVVQLYQIITAIFDMDIFINRSVPRNHVTG